MTSAASTSGTGGTGGTGGCPEVCSTLYDCGLELDAGVQLCPGFTGDPREKSGFVGGCVETCESNPALAALVDPSDCPGTISVIKGASAEFAAVCDNGF